MGIGKYLKRGFRYVRSGVPVQHTTADVYFLHSGETLKGKKIIVTGGGRGLGFAMVRKFTEEGADVLISGRNEETLKEASEKIGCSFLPLDVMDIGSFEDFIRRSDEMLGGVNVLVNNAGISLHEKSFMDVTPETFDRQINTNLRGGFFLAQKFVTLLREKNRNGSILFTSSETGGTDDIRPYGWSKAAVNSMVRGLAYVLAKEGIRVNAIAPGVTTSDMTGYSENGNLYVRNAVNQRIYIPGEVAETAAFLISDLAGCISGEIITLNNGKTINFRK